MQSNGWPDRLEAAARPTLWKGCSRVLPGRRLAQPSSRRAAACAPRAVDADMGGGRRRDVLRGRDGAVREHSGTILAGKTDRAADARCVPRRAAVGYDLRGRDPGGDRSEVGTRAAGADPGPAVYGEAAPSTTVTTQTCVDIWAR